MQVILIDYYDLYKLTAIVIFPGNLFGLLIEPKSNNSNERNFNNYEVTKNDWNKVRNIIITGNKWVILKSFQRKCICNRMM